MNRAGGGGSCTSSWSSIEGGVGCKGGIAVVAELWHVQPNSSSSNMMTMMLTLHGVGLCIVGALYLRLCDYDDLYIYDEVYVCGCVCVWGPM